MGDLSEVSAAGFSKPACRLNDAGIFLIKREI